MNEIVDRVRRAIEGIALVYVIHTARKDEGYEVVDKNQPASAGSSFGKVLWRDHTSFEEYGKRGLDRPPYEVETALSEHRARAAIEALREPNDAMITAIHSNHRPGWDVSWRTVWTTMIDAALKDE